MMRKWKDVAKSKREKEIERGNGEGKKGKERESEFHSSMGILMNLFS